MLDRLPSGTRLLPWSTPDGKPCYVVGDGTGYVSRVADNVERVQLDMAAKLLGHADDMLADRKTTPVQLRFLATRLVESLRDAHRIAESRGARLPVGGDAQSSHVEPDEDPDGPDRCAPLLTET
ncbi:hypothetical protein [Streptomyces lonegramiae]|uniref:Uncharacterized protein n=1 Tax=Streptomyces lonegramiae TaxID=3075524 RepID=A0ABU2XL37_9ACTN|nr:hypothetical protein [Streptomyces sp. DSM 41529]MDT0546616.1 hypothetical protein [Streptomyces sp. DSM 41529]